MSLAFLADLLLAILCFAVLVQSVRLMRSLRAVRSGGLAEMVGALDRATGEARTVLSELQRTLATEGAANARLIQEGKHIRDELHLMVGIGDATAERIACAASAANGRQLEEGFKAEMDG